MTFQGCVGHEIVWVILLPNLLEMLSRLHVQLKQGSVPGLQSSVAMVDHLLGSYDY